MRADSSQPAAMYRADTDWYQLREVAKVLNMKVLTYEIPA
jgi:hypothetical protein